MASKNEAYSVHCFRCDTLNIVEVPCAEGQEESGVRIVVSARDRRFFWALGLLLALIVILDFVNQSIQFLKHFGFLKG